MTQVPKTVTEMLQKEVGFNEEQTAKYKQLKEKQRERIRPMYDDMRNAKDSLFRLLSYPETSDSLLKEWRMLLRKDKRHSICRHLITLKSKNSLYS